MYHLLKRFFYALLLIGAGWLGAMPGYAAPLGDIGKIAAGGGHTCALTTAGGVKCWGFNDDGQLGDNSTTTRLTPVDVTGLASGVTAIVTGANHTCALTNAGGVKCWGNNSYGQLGDNSTARRLTPVDVASLASGVAAIDVGTDYTCALTTAGGVKCWGRNQYGQLGDNSGTNRGTPMDVTGLANGVTAISTGADHTCALTTAGGVKCWGANYSGQLGDNSTTTRLTPVDVTGLANGVTAISAGGTYYFPSIAFTGTSRAFSHTCALTTAGGVKCWGGNQSGQLGDNSTTDRLTPVDVAGLASGVTAIATGTAHTCALTTAGGVKCWGANSGGQLGDNSTTTRLAPVDVSGLASGLAAIATGFGHTCALTTAGGVKCWGARSGGRLGDNSTPTQRYLTPVDVTGFTSGLTAIAAGVNYTCALTTAGGVKCWGANYSGQLGDNSTTTRLTPVDVTGLASGVTAIAIGTTHTCALTTAGGVKCWGANSGGQLGDNSTTTRLAPVDVAGLASGVTAIAAGDGHTCALTTAGGLKCWGWNGYGQLGDNSTTTRLAPVDVTGLASGVTAIATGYLHTCAFSTAGGVKCWGGFITQSLTPVDVTGFASGVTALTAGFSHTCALTATGGAKCWGTNLYGEFGAGAISISSTPVDVTGLTSGVTAIATRRSHTCAVTTAGGAKCWGANFYGQLGDNSTTLRSTPVDVAGLANGVRAIATGDDHTCALTTAGGVKCWGNNAIGQIGDGTDGAQRVPVDVILTPTACYTAPSATGGGSVNACFTGGGPSCAYAAPQFIGAPPGTAPVPPTSPGPGIVFPHGLFDFSTSGCLAGNTLSFSITYPAALPPGTQYWKYGPTAANTTPHWYVLPATISGNTATFSITDGGLGDDDLVANGTIVDQGGPGAGSSSNAVPTLSEWAMGLLALLVLLTVAARRYRAAK